MGDGSYALPDLGGVTRLGLFTPGERGFYQLERSLDLFHSRGVGLVIQLGEALLPAGMVAHSNDVDNIRRKLSKRHQALLVCTDDSGRAGNLRRLGVRETGARTVRPNLVHLDPGFRTRLSIDNQFVVLGADCPASESGDGQSMREWFTTDGQEGRADRIGLAVSATQPDLSRIVNGLHPTLIVSTGSGMFIDESRGVDDRATGQLATRVIVFGDAGGHRVDHAIVHVTTGKVTLLPEPLESAAAPIQRADRPNS